MTTYISPRLRASILTLALSTGVVSAADDCALYRRGRQKELSELIDQTASEKVDHARISESFGRLPLGFEPNHGQTHRAADFIARGAGCTIFLNSTGAVLAPKNDTASKEK